MKRLTVAALSAVTFAMTAGAASAATLGLTEIFTGQGDKLFTTEIKRDENVNNNSQRGHDVFLRNNEETTGESFNVDWGASGSTYEWSVSYDGDNAFLTFGAFDPISIDVSPDGSWNAFQLFVRADDSDRFETASTTVTVDEINGMDASLEAIGALDGSFDKAFTLSDLTVIETIRGTVTFDFDPLDGASGSPNSRLGFSLKALYVVDPAVVPAPAALPLLLSGLAGLGLMARRRKKV